MDTQTETGRTKNRSVPRYGRDKAVHPFGWGKSLHDGRGLTKEINFARLWMKSSVDVNGQVLIVILWQRNVGEFLRYPLRDSRKEEKVGG